MVRTKSTAVNRVVEQIMSRVADERLRRLTVNCFVNTLETTIQWEDGEDPFVITGDIPAMWLRDSSCQVEPYVRFATEDPYIQKLLQGLIRRQADCIITDPYANAFNRTPSGIEGYLQDKTEKNPNVYERKFEIDSLCHPIRLWSLYFHVTRDETIFTPKLHDALRRIVEVCETELDHSQSEYRFERDEAPLSDTLSNGGVGSPTGITGMVWSGFRPSDDACMHHYLIPAQMFLTVVLSDAAILLSVGYPDSTLIPRVNQLKASIEDGLARHAVIEVDGIGAIWPYEVDGLGRHHIMDDANVPSLLSLPYLGYCSKDDPMYKRTRSAILSPINPYFYDGAYAHGIGSPHTPKGYVWPISIIMQALTSDSESEIDMCIQMLMRTDADTEYMHEGFDPDDPSQFTRAWFAWANSLFAELMLRRLGYPAADAGKYGFL